MKKTFVAIILVASGLFAPSKSFGQDLLTNPQNQEYLFTAGTDETQAFLYNPAYLGLRDRGGVLDGYYFFPNNSELDPSEKFHDFGLFAQRGKLAIGYRNASTNVENLNQYSIGFGVGNAGAAIGASLSYMEISSSGARWFPSVGLLWCPDRYLSFGASYHNFTDVPFGVHQIEKLTDLGVSIRPFGDESLTFNGDFILTNHHEARYKAGVALELLPGFKVYGIFDPSGYGSSGYVPPAPSAGPVTLVPPYLWTNPVSFGISFNFGNHIHAEGASSYQSGIYTATYGRLELTTQDLPTIIHDKRIAEIVIRGPIHDGKEPAFFFGKSPKDLLDYIDEIRKCGNDPSIKALILKIYPYSTSETFFALSGETQELADAVEYVRSKGKKVFAYLADDSGVNELYLASAADKIYMPPASFIANYGIDFDLVRLKGLFDKLHIAWNAKTAGKYKSTFHTSYTDSATPDQAKLIQGLVDNVYAQMVKQIEANRAMTLDDGLKSDLAGLISSTTAARLHLIDGVAYFDQFKKDVGKEVLGNSGDIATVNPEQIHSWKTRWGKRPEVAVIGVYGTIMTGKSSPPSPFPIPFLGGDRLTGSETVISQIKEAVEDKNIKAIVLRVNSGGGSALASDEIYNAIKEAMAKKPVVASFGNVAASGGYYVAVGAKKIFAEPATLTGSIGVLIAFPVLTDFIKKDLGGNVEQYKSRDASGVLNPFHKWDEKDMKYVDEFLNQTYTDFKEKVSEGRKLSMNRVDELAQGKVYTGDQAKHLGLIDEFGGLEKAIHYAANIAGISGSYRVKIFVVPGLGLGNLLRLGAELLDGYSD